MTKPLFWLTLVVGAFSSPALQAQDPVLPRVSTQQPETVQAAILAASTAGQTRIVIPPGIYRIPASTTGANLEFNGLKNLEIDAKGVTLLMVDNSKTGVYFRDCQNVTLRGATIRNETIPFTQGKIESIADDRKSFVLKIADGYPTTLDDPHFFNPETTYYIFDRRSRRLKDNTYDYGSTSAEKLDTNRFRISFGGALGQEVEVGDLTSMRGRGGSGVHSDNCSKMRFDGVSVEYAGGFGWFETGGDGANFYNNIKVKPGPKPQGAVEEPLMASNADGFHSASVKVGPTIQNSSFTRMPDDGIAIHGEYQMVRTVTANTLVCMRPWGGIPYHVGDKVAWVKKNGIPGDEATVSAVKSLPDDFLPPLTTDFRHFQNNHNFFELTLDKPVAAQEGDVVSNLDRSGRGYILRNNTIVNHRARGLLLKARDGLVENNLIDGSSIAGIVLGPELWWGEANYSSNVIIRDNTVTHCGYATTGPWNEQAGTLTVLGTRDSPEARGHNKLTIENNYFVGNDGVNVVLDGLEDSVFRGNRFLNAQLKPNIRGKDHYDPGTLVFINRAHDLVLQNNLAQRTGSANTALIKTTRAATNIKGLKDGVREAPARSAGVPSPFDFQYLASNGEPQREVRDPAITKEGNTFYMTFTMWPFANREDDRMKLPNNGSSPGIRIFSSKDLKTWTPGNWLVKSSNLPVDSPYKHRFWAPEIHKFNNKFYLIFTADNWLKGEYNREDTWGAAGYAFVGVSNKVDGPYQHITYIPQGACDTTLTQGNDGTIYAVMPKYDMFARPIDLSKLEKGVVQWLGPEKKILDCSSSDTILGTYPNYLEGPWVEKVGSRFVMFYAETFDHGYWTGAAYANSPAGPWRKDPRGLIFWGGHTSLFNGPDGRKWVSYRVEDSLINHGSPGAVPLDFDGNGRVLIEALPSPK